MSRDPPTSYRYIVRSPDVRGGHPRVEGTRIGVHDVIGLLVRGRPFDSRGPRSLRTGARPGTFDSCSLRNRLDYIFIPKSLEASCTGGALFRKGLWGDRVTRPTAWETYPEITRSVEQGVGPCAGVCRVRHLTPSHPLLVR